LWKESQASKRDHTSPHQCEKVARSHHPTRAELEVNDGRDVLFRRGSHHEHNHNNEGVMHNLAPCGPMPTIVHDHVQDDLRIVVI